MNAGRCPICDRPATPRARGNDAFPFCGRACKMVDLGRWLDGSYRVEAEPDDAVPPPTDPLDD